MRRTDRAVAERAAVLDIIARADSCRLGLVDLTGPTPRPYVVALNFGFSENPDRFWFHCAPAGRKLDLVGAGAAACLQLDCDHLLVRGARGCDWGMSYASVYAEGRVVRVDDPAERLAGLEAIMAQYGGANHGGFDPRVLAATAVLRFDVESMSAKRKPAPPATGA